MLNVIVYFKIFSQEDGIMKNKVKILSSVLWFEDRRAEIEETMTLLITRRNGDLYKVLYLLNL